MAQKNHVIENRREGNFQQIVAILSLSHTILTLRCAALTNYLARTMGHCSLLITIKHDIQSTSVPEHTAASKCSLIYSSTAERNGRFVDDRYRNKTAYPYSRKYLVCTQRSNEYSALVAPLVPVEKLSINRTVFFSSGTVVPPEVTITTFLLFETAV